MIHIIKLHAQKMLLYTTCTCMLHIVNIYGLYYLLKNCTQSCIERLLTAGFLRRKGEKASEGVAEGTERAGRYSGEAEADNPGKGTG